MFVMMLHMVWSSGIQYVDHDQPVDQDNPRVVDKIWWVDLLELVR